MPLADVIPLVPRALGARSDDELMALARGDNRDAFATLVARHAGRLTAFCVKMTGDRRAGEDVAQETWLAVWSARQRYRPSERLDAFLFTIARNRCRNALRSRWRAARVISRQLSIEGRDRDAPAEGTSLDAILDRERARRVEDAAQCLPDKLREAVLLRFVAGLDYAAISAAIGRNESTVRSRVFHGLRQLRELVEEVS